MKMKSTYIITALLLTSCITGFAQRANSGSPVEVGSQLKDVTAYLDDGSAFPIREKLKDKYAVIVFGCLT